MSDQTTPLPPAGWYADPENSDGERWWNGSAWGDQRRPSTLVPPVPPAPAAGVTPEPAPIVPAVDERPNPYATPTPAGQPNPYGQANPYASAPPAPNQNPTALVGFIISMSSILLNLVFTGLFGIAGGIVSAIGLSKANRLAAQGVTANGRGLAIAGTIVGFVTGGFTLLVGTLFIVLSIASRA